jgi:hypothetical protein
MSFGTVQAEKMTTESGYSLGAGNASSFKNRIINGGQVIDQRNAGASVTASTAAYTFITDRFKIYSSGATKLSGQRTTTAPTGFTNSLAITSLAATSPGAGDEYQLYAPIEGYNIADLGWGTASAQTVTLSFWVRSSLTGTFSGCLYNPGGTPTVSYIYTYTISSANTWEYKTITVPGNTTATWGSTNDNGISIVWDLGSGSNLNGTAGSWATGFDSRTSGSVTLVGTNGATFNITGVQFEVGTVATSFDFRSYGTELQLCQRYFQSFSYTGGTMIATGSTFGASTGALPFNFYFPMRTTPSTITLPAVGSTNGQWTVLSPAGGFPGTFGTIVVNSAGPNSMRLDFTGYTGVFASSGQAAFLYASGSTTTVVTASAEL